MILKIGTRGSKLALAQSRWIKEKIETQHPNVRVEQVRVKTTGDKILDSPLSKIGGKGLFVKEIEEALIEKRIDLAVHSMKDVPVELPDALTLTAFPEREDPRDAFISAGNQPFEQLRPGAKVGTSSLRRAAQLLHMRQDLDLVSLRGNVDTRLRKLELGELTAIILAVAGLKRLGFESRITQIFSPEQVLPAIGQGALGLEVRRDDEQTIGLVRFLSHKPTEAAIRAERAFLQELQGGCQVPIAGFAQLDGKTLTLTGMVAELDGRELVKDKTSGPWHQAEEIGTSLARALLSAGADIILKKIYGEA